MLEKEKGLTCQSAQPQPDLITIKFHAAVITVQQTDFFDFTKFVINENFYIKIFKQV